MLLNNSKHLFYFVLFWGTGLTLRKITATFSTPNVAYYSLLLPALHQRLTQRVHGANNETAQLHSLGSADVFSVQPLLAWIALALVAKYTSYGCLPRAQQTQKE